MEDEIQKIFDDTHKERAMDVMEVECPTFGLTLSNPVSKLAVPMTAIGVL